MSLPYSFNRNPLTQLVVTSDGGVEQLPIGSLRVPPPVVVRAVALCGGFAGGLCLTGAWELFCYIGAAGTTVCTGGAAILGCVVVAGVVMCSETMSVPSEAECRDKAAGDQDKADEWLKKWHQDHKSGPPPTGGWTLEADRDANNEWARRTLDIDAALAACLKAAKDAANIGRMLNSPMM